MIELILKQLASFPVKNFIFHTSKWFWHAWCIFYKSDKN